MSLVLRKPAFCICENKDADQLRGDREADQRLCFRYIVQSLYFLNPKVQASSHLVWLYSLVCVGPGRKPRRPFFSQQVSNDTAQLRSLFAVGAFFVSSTSQNVRKIVVTSVAIIPTPISVTLHQSFLEVHILTTIYQKAFILGP